MYISLVLTKCTYSKVYSSVHIVLFSAEYHQHEVLFTACKQYHNYQFRRFRVVQSQRVLFLSHDFMQIQKLPSPKIITKSIFRNRGLPLYIHGVVVQNNGTKHMMSCNTGLTITQVCDCAMFVYVL